MQLLFFFLQQFQITVVVIGCHAAAAMFEPRVLLGMPSLALQQEDAGGCMNMCTQCMHTLARK